ncbi:hypothetical protein FXO37_11846 [Capsicum annuum]|nr:hypothetical protein FXO37_11846 [Capsicum annuum]
MWWNEQNNGTYKVSSGFKLLNRITDQLGEIFINFRGIQWVMPSKIVDTLSSWEEAGMGAKNRAYWRIILASICQCWDIIRHDLIAAMQNFYMEGIFEKSMNATFIALIPKKVGAIELTNFRPISLVGGVYKIIAKLLAERLKKVTHKLIDRQQMTFIKGRQIMDAVMIANELVDSRVKSNQPGILCKLDIQKAYDHLNWSFLVKILLKMGFGTRWIRWIKQCMSTVRFSVLINRNPNGFFPSQRGLRQGDPLSPFLFILAMEGLSNLINTTKSKGLVRGFQVENRAENNLEITHLQYAEDTLVFCKAIGEQFLVLRAIYNFLSGRATHNLPGNASRSKKQIKGNLELSDREVRKKVGIVEKSIFVQRGEIDSENLLWKEVIMDKYGMEDKWMTVRVDSPYGFSQATVAELWTGQGWNLHFRRNLNDWEISWIAEFYITIAQINNLSGEEDSMVWKADKICAYRDLNTTGVSETEWPWKMIWSTKIPYKVETVNHLFLHCKWTDQLWQMFINMRKLIWVKPGRIKEVLKSWNRDGNAAKKEERWKIVPASIWWTFSNFGFDMSSTKLPHGLGLMMRWNLDKNIMVLKLFMWLKQPFLFFIHRPQEVVIFIVGGTTYEESRSVALQNSTNSGIRFILGGSALLNSKRFLKDLEEAQRIARINTNVL